MTQQIYIKSEDFVSCMITQEEMTTSSLYSHVYENLPDYIRPEEMWQMILFSQEGEIDEGDNMISLKNGEILHFFNLAQLSPNSNINIQLMSGESITFTLPNHVSASSLYLHVYKNLPDDIRPEEMWQITLFDGEEEIIDDAHGIFVKNDQTIHCIIESRSLSVSPGEIEIAVNEDDQNSVEKIVFTFKSSRKDPSDEVEDGFDFNSGNVSFLHCSFVYDPEQNIYYDDIMEWNYIGRYGNELSFKLPLDAQSLSFEEVVNRMVSRLPFSSRAKKNMKFLLQFNMEYRMNIV